MFAVVNHPSAADKDIARVSHPSAPLRSSREGLHRIARALTIVLTSTAFLTACSAPSGTTSSVEEVVEPPATGRSAEQKDALLDYVEAERATLPSVLAAASGVYSDATVEATFETISNHRYLPDGVHAMVWYDYTYVPGYDLAAAYRQIEASENEITGLCETAIFPVMREFGVDPPFGVTFTYHAAEDTIAPLTTLSCSAVQ